MRHRGNLLVLVFLCNQAMLTAIIKMCNACEKNNRRGKNCSTNKKQNDNDNPCKTGQLCPLGSALVVSKQKYFISIHFKD